MRPQPGRVQRVGQLPGPRPSFTGALRDAGHKEGRGGLLRLQRQRGGEQRCVYQPRR